MIKLYICIMKWTTLSSEYLYRENWFTVRKEKCEKPDGKIVDPYYVFEFPNGQQRYH